MFFFSQLLSNIPSSIFLQSTTNITYHLSIYNPILHLPSKLGALHHCIQIYEWFYNIYHLFVNSHNGHPIYFRSSVSHPIQCRRIAPKFSLHHLSFFIYIIFTSFVTLGVHQHVLPSIILGTPPAMILCWCSSSSSFIHRFQQLPISSTCLINAYSTNYQKLCYLTAWQSTHASTLRLMEFSSDKALCIDSGASCCISNDKRDFTSFTMTTSSVLNGILSRLQIESIGTLQLTLQDDLGNDITILLPNSLYVPQAPMCLLSPQHMAQHTNSPNDGFLCRGNLSVLTFSGFCHTILYNSMNNLPIIFFGTDTESIDTTGHPYASLLSSSLDLSQNPTNLTSVQHKLLHAHQKLGHLNFDTVQYLARSGVLGPAFQSIGNCPIPLCHACVHGKQHCHSVPHDPLPLDVSHLEPGDCVSCDQLESLAPGLIPVYHGTPSMSKYHAGSLFVDHASRYLYFTPHISTGVQEALQAKHTFESVASQHHPFVKPHHADNGLFTSKDFRAHCAQQKQRLTFCGVNAHHQNGIAEHYIRSVTDRARSMLINVMNLGLT
jgi:hypothetical protein